MNGRERIMAELEANPAGLTTSDLAARCHLSASRVSELMRYLEAEGRVARAVARGVAFWHILAGT